MTIHPQNNKGFALLVAFSRVIRGLARTFIIAMHKRQDGRFVFSNGCQTRSSQTARCCTAQISVSTRATVRWLS